MRLQIAFSRNNTAILVQTMISKVIKLGKECKHRFNGEVICIYNMCFPLFHHESTHNTLKLKYSSEVESRK